MDWSLGYSASYYLTRIDPNTWRDLERYEILSGSISHSNESLRESADVSCTGYSDTTEQWIRIWLDARQDGNIEHIPIFTGLSQTPGEEINGTLVTRSLQCYSVLKPAEDILLPRGWYAPIDANGVILIQSLLDVIKAPVVVDGDITSLNLTDAIIAEDGESNLTMIDKILLAINWRIKIGGNGTVTLCPVATDTSMVFDTQSNDVLEPTLSVTYDWFACPNVFRAVMNRQSAIARDDSENSPYSTVNRGREVWAEETNCDLYSGETIAEYAVRRLKELQSVAQTISYTRRFTPDIYTSDIVRLNLPAQRISGAYIITSQSIELGYGARTSEEVQYVWA